MLLRRAIGTVLTIVVIGSVAFGILGLLISVVTALIQLSQEV